MAGRIVAVCTSETKGVKKENVGEAYLQPHHGVVGDAHAGDWHRQVSLLSTDSIQKMRAKGLDVTFGDFAENVTVEGMELFTLPVGTRLKIGEALCEVTQIGKQCHKGCAIFQQVGDCVMPREGIFVKVLEPGKVKVNDTVEVVGDV